MDVGAQPLTRARRLALSERAFRLLTLANAAMLIVIVATGATVRLTGSGLGCHHWPGCTAGDPLPANGVHSYVEFSNRVVAFFTILVTLATWLFAPRRRRLAFATFLGTLLQAPLGAITVYYHLNPWLVLTHFLLSLVVLTLGVILALEVWAPQWTSLPAWIPRVGLLVGAAACVLIFSGVLATASGPHPGSAVVRRLWSFQPAVYWHVRATAVFGISFAFVLVALWRRHATQLRVAFVLLALLALQMTIGEIQYRTHLPWWLVLVHVTVAATVWAAVTAFVFSLWRPRRMA